MKIHKVKDLADFGKSFFIFNRLRVRMGYIWDRKGRIIQGVNFCFFLPWYTVLVNIHCEFHRVVAKLI